MKRRLTILLAFVLLTPLLLGSSDCSGRTSADKVQSEQTAALANEAQRQVGMAGITNFTERKFVKYLYELRDQTGFATYTYIVDLNGGLHFVCESVGYGIPYSAQFTNPGRIVRGYNNSILTAQSEPNGLFTPDGLSATWILCVDGEGGIKPVYSEPELMVAPFELKAVDSYVR